MRIISEFRDYYDSVLTYGIDPLLKYVRKQQKFEFMLSRWEKKKLLPDGMEEIIKPVMDLLIEMPYEISVFGKNRNSRGRRIAIIPEIIGFCGTLHPVMKVLGHPFYSTEALLVGLTQQELDQEFITRRMLSDTLEDKDTHILSTWNKYLTHKSWKKSVEEIGKRRFDPVFVGLKVPVFKVGPKGYYSITYAKTDYELVLNPSLREVAFQRIKPPVECFQEISMYLGNELVCQKDPNINISDEVLRDEKGFDKWSFRRHKDENKS